MPVKKKAEKKHMDYCCMCSAPQYYRTAMGSVGFSKMKMKTNHDYLVVDVDNVRKTDRGHIIKQLFID